MQTILQAVLCSGCTGSLHELQHTAYAMSSRTVHAANMNGDTRHACSALSICTCHFSRQYVMLKAAYLALQQLHHHQRLQCVVAAQLQPSLSQQTSLNLSQTVSLRLSLTLNLRDHCHPACSLTDISSDQLPR